VGQALGGLSGRPSSTQEEAAWDAAAA